MVQTPENCRFRIPLPAAGDAAVARCEAVATLVGSDGDDFCIVQRDACEACCKSLKHGERLNPVIASLAYRAADEISRRRGADGRKAKAAEELKGRLRDHLALVRAGLDDCSFPPQQATAPQTSSTRQPTGSGRSELTWQAAVLAAPRRQATLGAALASLHAAGFDVLHVFAEPGTDLPPEAERAHVTVHDRRLGNFANFYSSLAQLYRESPDADAFAMFQDDIRIARGARAWCSAQLWPFGNGLVSLFTPRIHAAAEAGWRLLSPGFYRVFGAQAIVFRRDVLEQFLADPQVLHAFERGRHCDDAVVSGWAARRRLAIAYHTPSLVQHCGEYSSIWTGAPNPRLVADAVADVDRVASWRSPSRRAGKIGLVGWHARSGLGYQTLDLAKRLPIDRWLIPRHPQFPLPPLPRVRCRLELASPSASAPRLRLAGRAGLAAVRRAPVFRQARAPRTAARRQRGLHTELGMAASAACLAATSRSDALPDAPYLSTPA